MQTGAVVVGKKIGEKVFLFLGRMQCDDIVAQCIQDQTDRIAAADFFHHGATVGLDCARAQAESVANLEICEFLADERQDFQLACAELRVLRDGHAAAARLRLGASGGQMTARQCAVGQIGRTEIFHTLFKI